MECFSGRGPGTSLMVLALYVAAAGALLLAVAGRAALRGRRRGRGLTSGTRSHRLEPAASRPAHPSSAALTSEASH
ncbi:MAG TPA: hypothetical protein VF060_01935 [Trebonia sp.]